MNKLILSGHLGKDPDMNYTPGGYAITKFSLGVTEFTKDKDGNSIKKTLWVNIKCLGKTAENTFRYLKVGSPVNIIGKLVIDEYTDKSGQKKYWTECLAEQVEFTGSNPDKKLTPQQLEENPFNVPEEGAVF